MNDKTIRIWGSNFRRLQKVAKEVGGGFLTPNFVLGELLDHWENCPTVREAIRRTTVTVNEKPNS